MKAIPQYSDFELDYKKFPIRQVGGIQDMNYVNRMDYRDSMFKNAKEQWMEEAEQQIKELNVYKVQAYEQLEQIKELKDTTYFKHLQKEIEEAQMSVEQQKKQIKELKDSIQKAYKQGFDDGANLPHDDYNHENNSQSIGEYSSERESYWIEFKQALKK